MLTETVPDVSRLEAELAEARAQNERYQEAMRQMLGVCREAARGNLEPRLRDLRLGEDVDEMRRGINHLLDLVDAFVREAGASLTHASEGKYYRRVLERGMLGSFRLGAATINRANAALAHAAGELAEAEARKQELARDFERAVKSVAEHVAAASTEMRATAAGLAQSSVHTAAKAQEVAQSAEHASGSVTSVAGAQEELSSTVAEIERQVAASSQAARGAVAETGRATTTVEGLNDASRQIGQVITVITHVANQTRLLALNATIEAARAGEAGKGFAVVASEVKNLASQTAEATERIGQQVAAIQSAAGNATAAITGIGEAIKRVDEIAATISTAVGEQRLATNEISRNVHQAASATRTVSGSILDVTRATQETSEAASQMEAAAAELSRMSEELQGQVGRFLTEIRGGAGN